MNENKLREGVWFVYDGACPICNSAAHAMRIKAELGSLHLLNARTDFNHPLIEEINRRNINLDEGMVIFHSDQFFHGKRALDFMALYAGPKGFFNWMNKLLFRSNTLAAISYPCMRATRNLLLFVRGKKQIDNLRSRSQPIFKSIFGDNWDAMPPIMHRHYANRPYCDETNIVNGTMEVQAAPILRLFSPILRILGGIPAVNEKNVPVTVRFESDPNSSAFHFNRTFHFRDRKPYIFHSKMIPQSRNEVVEKMQFGLGWCVAFHWENEKVILKHNGYCLCLFEKFIPLPITWLIGTVHAEEEAIDETSFKMFVEMTHPLFGKIYEYGGIFNVVSTHD